MGRRSPWWNRPIMSTPSERRVPRLKAVGRGQLATDEEAVLPDGIRLEPGVNAHVPARDRLLVGSHAPDTRPIGPF
jgi:hypothetical protein